MKELWVKADHDLDWEKRKVLVTTALESGANAVLVRKGEASKVRELGRIMVVSEDREADIHLTKNIEELSEIPGRKAFYQEILGKEDEERISKAGRASDYVIVNARDWKVIPLENLIADLKDKSKIIAEVRGREEAKLALETLEIGSDGVLLDADIGEIKAVKNLIEEMSSKRMDLQGAEVLSIEALGSNPVLSLSVCSIPSLEEGILVSSDGRNFLPVASEGREDPWEESTSFRFNVVPNSVIKLVKGRENADNLTPGLQLLSTHLSRRSRPLLMDSAGSRKTHTFLVKFQGGEIILPENSSLLSRDGIIPPEKLKKGDEILVLSAL